jgi:hypothetical protein
MQRTAAATPHREGPQYAQEKRVTRHKHPELTSVRNWTALRTGDRVLIEETSGGQRTGFIDEISLSGNVLWIRYSALNSRQLIHKTEVADIKCRPEEINTARLAALLQPSAKAAATAVPESIR